MLALAMMIGWGTACQWEEEASESDLSVVPTGSVVGSPRPGASSAAQPTDTAVALPTEIPTVLPAETFTALPTETPAVLPTESPAVIPTETPPAAPTESSVPSPTPTAENPVGPPNAECWRSENWPPVDCSTVYLPGQVIVVFKQGITRTQAAELIESFGLTFDPDLLTDLYVWFDVGPDASGHLRPLDEVVQELKRNELVHDALPECYNKTVDTDRCITVFFRRGLTTEEVSAFLASYSGLTLLEDRTLPEHALVCIEPGQESTWIDTFEAQDAVDDAELNGIARPPEQCMPTPLPSTPLVP